MKTKPQGQAISTHDKFVPASNIYIRCMRMCWIELTNEIYLNTCIDVYANEEKDCHSIHSYLSYKLKKNVRNILRRFFVCLWSSFVNHKV